MLGVATSGATLFRSIGGSLGTAVLGAIFSGRLTAELADKLPRGGAGAGTEGGINPAQIERLPGPLHDAYISSFTDALNVVFLVATGVMVLAFVLAWFIREQPLRATVETSAGLGESLGAPVDTDSLREVTRGLSAPGRPRADVGVHRRCHAPRRRRPGARSGVAAPACRSAGRARGSARDP